MIHTASSSIPQSFPIAGRLIVLFLLALAVLINVLFGFTTEHNSFPPKEKNQMENQMEHSKTFSTFAEAGTYYATAAASITREIADQAGATIISPPVTAPGGGACQQTSGVTVGSVGAFGHALERLSSQAWEESTHIVARHAAELGYNRQAAFTDGAGNPHLVIYHESGNGYIAWSQAKSAVLSISSPCLTVHAPPESAPSTATAGP